MIETLLLKTRLVKTVALIVAGSMTLSALAVGALADKNVKAFTKFDLVNLFGDLRNYGIVANEFNATTSDYESNFAAVIANLGGQKPHFDKLPLHGVCDRVINMEFDGTVNTPNKYFVLYKEDGDVKTFVHCFKIIFSENAHVSAQYTVPNEFRNDELKISQIESECTEDSISSATFIGEADVFPAHDDLSVHRTVAVEDKLLATNVVFEQVDKAYLPKSDYDTLSPTDNGGRIAYVNSQTGSTQDLIYKPFDKKDQYFEVTPTNYVRDMLGTIPNVSKALSEFTSGSWISVYSWNGSLIPTSSKDNKTPADVLMDNVKNDLQTGKFVIVNLSMKDTERNTYLPGAVLRFQERLISNGDWDTNTASRLIFNITDAQKDTLITLQSGYCGILVAPNCNVKKEPTICGAIYTDKNMDIGNGEVHMCTVGMTFYESFSREFKDTTTDFTFKKTDDKNAALENAGFTLYDRAMNQIGDEVKSDVNGNVTFKDLEYGATYYVMETKAPDGYTADTNKYTLTIDINGNCTFNAKNNTIINKPDSDTTSFSFTKTDGTKALEGAKFGLYDNANLEKAIGEATSAGVNGTVTFENIPYSKLNGATYYIKEISALSENYTKDETAYKLTITNKGVATSNMTGNTVVNTPKYAVTSFSFTKTDGVKTLEGAMFSIYDAAGKIAGTAYSGEDGIVEFDNLFYSTQKDITYTIKEVKAPNGYIADANEYTVTFDTNGNVKSTTVPTVNGVKTIINKPIKLGFSFKKTDGVNAISGVGFTLYSDTQCEKIVASAQSGTDGVVTFSNLAYDVKTYYLKETTPAGYKTNNAVYTVSLNENGTAVISEDGTTVLKNNTIVNEKLFKIELQKTFEGPNPEDLTGVVFGLYETNEALVAKTGIDGNRTAVFTNETTNIALGKTYYMQEISSAKGYACSDQKFFVKVSLDGEVTYSDAINGTYTALPPTCLNCEKDYGKTDFTFKKTDNNSASLDGATFGLYAQANDSSAIKTAVSINGTVTFDNLDYDKTYYIKEISAPKGYIADTKTYTLTIGKYDEDTKTATKTLKDANGTSVTAIKNTPTTAVTSFSFTKTDDKNVALDGAEFTLTAPDGTKTTMTSANGGKISFTGLTYSEIAGTVTTYTIEETKAPNGYEANDIVYTLTIKDDGTKMFTYLKNGVTTNAAVVEINGEKVIAIENMPKYAVTSFSFTKTDGTKALEGAKFGLYDNANLAKAIGEATSAGVNGTVTFESISYSMVNGATYYIKEISAPSENYTKDETAYKLTITNKGVATSNMTGNTVVNKPKYAVTSFSFTKTDGVKALEGAKFGLYDNANLEKAIGEATSAGVNGTVTFESISYSMVSGATYYIKEISAPKGYIANTNEYTVTFNADGKVKETNFPVKNGAYVIANEKIKISIELIKTFTDNISDDLARTTLFGLYSETGSKIAQAYPQKFNGVWTFKFTNDNTGISVDNTYFLKEISAPEGFDASDAVFYCFVDEDGKVTYNTKNNKLTATEDVPECKNVKTPTEETTTTTENTTTTTENTTTTTENTTTTTENTTTTTENTTTTTENTTTTAEETTTTVEETTTSAETLATIVEVTEEISTTTVLTNATEEVTTTVPNDDDDDTITIIDEDTALSEIPNTGVKSYMLVFAIIGGAALTVCGAVSVIDIYKRNLRNIKK